MAFHVPDKFCAFFDEVEQRSRLLIKRQIITGIDEIRLDAWLANFTSDTDRYLAARMLDGLMFRSRAMICSSIDHLLQCVLPGDLRGNDLFPYASIEEFLESLRAGDQRHPYRFVAVDGSKEKEEPGKSGTLIIRHFRQHARIAKSLTCRPENLAVVPSTVKVLVFVDDFVGTGTQFETFATRFNLSEHAKTRELLYCPLMAFHQGEDKVAKAHPWLTIKPIELLYDKHCFFHSNVDQHQIWAVDEENTVSDVRNYVQALAKAKEIPATTRYGLELLLGFEHATPNNSLPMLWAESPKWRPLLMTR